MLFHHLIWDFDGTLFDTYPAVIRAMLLGLADLGITEQEDRIAYLLGDTLGVCFQTMVDQYGLDSTQLEARVDFHHAQIPLEAQPPFPGVRQLCEQFRAAGGYHYIVTHRGNESLRHYLDLHGMTSLFTDCITRDDRYPRKPDPASFVAMLERHNLSCADTLAIGDRPLDILAAQGAGIRACWFGPVPPVDVQPDYCIRTYAELERILDIT